jgi:hypothetical protein
MATEYSNQRFGSELLVQRQTETPIEFSMRVDECVNRALQIPGLAKCPEIVMSADGNGRKDVLVGWYVIMEKGSGVVYRTDERY